MCDRQSATPSFDLVSPMLTAFSKYGSAFRYLPILAKDAALLHHAQAKFGSSSMARSLHFRASGYLFRSKSDTPLLYQPRWLLGSSSIIRSKHGVASAGRFNSRRALPFRSHNDGLLGSSSSAFALRNKASPYYPRAKSVSQRPRLAPRSPSRKASARELFDSSIFPCRSSARPLLNHASEFPAFSAITRSHASSPSSFRFKQSNAVALLAHACGSRGFNTSAQLAASIPSSYLFRLISACALFSQPKLAFGASSIVRS